MAPQHNPTDAPIPADQVESAVQVAAGKLRNVSDDRAAQPMRPGEWTAKQLIGHLIDSALNNHQRVVRAQITEHLDADGVLQFPGYVQEQWVERGGYQERSWSDLIDLWVALNAQLCTVLRTFHPASMTVPLSLEGGHPIEISRALDYADHLQVHLADLALLQTEPPVLRELPLQIPVDDELRLRLPRASDGPTFIAAVQDPEIPRWTTVPSPYGQAEWDAWLDRENKRTVSHDLCRNYVVVDNTDTVIGMVGLVRVRPADETGEIGYWLSASQRGKGVVTRALAALMREVLRAGYARVDAEVLVGNPASQRVLERAGFTHEGVLRSVGSHGCGVDAYRIDVHLYSVILSDPIVAQLLATTEQA